MDFTLDGEPFSLTPEVVRARLADHVPEAVREYWVEIDGTKWPVKQVISLATGVTRRNRFQSQDSRRWLQNLDFKIGAGPASEGSPPTVATAERLDPAPNLEPLDTVEIRVAFTWLSAGHVMLEGDGLPRFPPLPMDPGLYRFDFGLDDEGVRTYYIGESVSLRRRASNYRNAKTDGSRQRTSRRIHKELVRHLQLGGTVQFAIATAVELEASGALADLRYKSARRLAENAAVLSAQRAEGVSVLNIDMDLPESESAD